MDIVIRATITYFSIWIILRISGKRTLAQATTFDFILLLIISEATQGALTKNDGSLTTMVIAVSTLVGIDIVLSLIKQKSKFLEQVFDSTPVIIAKDGAMVQLKSKMERIDKEDIMAAARELQGLERLEQVKYAILEPNGTISIVPKHS